MSMGSQTSRTASILTNINYTYATKHISRIINSFLGFLKLLPVEKVNDDGKRKVAAAAEIFTATTNEVRHP